MMRSLFHTMLRSHALAIAVIVSLCCPACGALHMHRLLVHSQADWPMAGRTAAAAYADTSQTLRLPLSVLWEYTLPGGTGTSAAIVVDSVLVCGTLYGEFTGVNIVNGKEFGSKKISTPISAAPVSVGNELYLCAKAGRETVFDYNLRSGEFIWKKNIGGIEASPVVARTTLVAGTLDGTVFALRTSDGETMWKFRCGAPIHAALCADDSLVYVGDTHGVVYALRIGSGTLAWKQAAAGPLYGGLSVVRGIVYAGSRDHRLYALDAATGCTLWSHDCGERIMASVSANDSLVIVPALNGSVTALTHAGTVVWSFSARSAVNTPCVILRTMVIVASLDTYIYALSITDGSVLWKQGIEARLKTAPLVWNGSLIVIGDDRVVRRFASK